MAADLAKAIAASVGFLALALYLPVLGTALSLFLPLPLIYYRLSLGGRGGAVALAFAAAFLAAAGRSDAAAVGALVYFALLLLGFLQGTFIEKRFPLEVVVGGGALLAAGTAGALFLIIYSATGGAVADHLRSQITTFLQALLKARQDMGAPLAQQELIAENMDQVVTGWMRLMPALAAAWILFASWVNFLAARRIAAARGLAFPPYGDLTRWKAPEALVWVLIGCGILAWVPETRPAGVSGLLILGMVYFFQGVAVIEFWLEKKSAHGALKLIVYLLIALWQILLLLVAAVGLFDLWADFRRLSKTEET
ncbi:MAG: DUF2232 domain-containing protein [Deltaproteobacteria bacterium]|nr:DUF2232 domain-containing protein [Deltaproteobacteria bacterium]